MKTRTPRDPHAVRDEWLTVDEVCTELKISRRTFDRWRALGTGPRVQAPRRQRNGPHPAQLARAVAGHHRRGHRLTSSFDFHPWKIETRKGRKTSYRVRWVVARRQFGCLVPHHGARRVIPGLAITAARKGEGFDTDSGLPESMERKRRDVTVLPARRRVHRRGVARGRGQDPRIHHRDPGQSRPRRRPGPARHTRPRRAQARAEKEAQPGPARRPARRRRDQSPRLAGPGLPPGQRPRGPLSRLRRPRRPGPQARRQTRQPRVLLPPPPRPAQAPRLRGPQEKTHQEPAQQSQPARRLDTPAGPRRHPRPARRRQPRPGRRHAQSLRHHRQTAGPALHRVLRLHVLRADAPLRSRRAHQSGLPPARQPDGAT